MPLRFLFLNQFYPPDVAPTGRVLHDVATTLVGRGHAVRVLCGRRGYGTGVDLGPGAFLDGVEVRRLAAPRLGERSLVARAARDALFLLSAGIKASRAGGTVDLLVTASSPPLIGVAAGLASRWRRVPHVQWTMDLYPDALQAHWRLGPGTWVGSILDAFGRFQFRHAAAVVTLGPHMSRRVSRHLSDDSRVRSVPLWSEPHLEEEAAARQAWRSRRGWGDELVLMYSGNMGRGHRFGEFLEAARRLGAAGPRWVFVGGGARRPEVERFIREHPSARVELLPYVPATDLGASLWSADTHLVSLSDVWQGIIVPSKLQAAFGSGRPVLFVGPADNEIAHWVRESGGGWVIPEEDVEALMRAVLEAGDVTERVRRGQAALAFARHHFDRDLNRARVADVLEECASAGLSRRATKPARD